MNKPIPPKPQVTPTPSVNEDALAKIAEAFKRGHMTVLDMVDATLATVYGPRCEGNSGDCDCDECREGRNR